MSWIVRAEGGARKCTSVDDAITLARGFVYASPETVERTREVLDGGADMAGWCYGFVSVEIARET